MKRLILYTLCWLTLSSVIAQDTLTLEMCHHLATDNYPLIKQRALLTKSKSFTLENVAKGRLPQITLAGQATYQSDVTEVPIRMPGVEINRISKDQYKVYAEAAQTLYQGRAIKEQEDLEKTKTAIDEAKLEIELYQIKDKINMLFFGVLLLQHQLQQNELLQKDIVAGIDKIQAAIHNGTALKSAGDVLEAERLKADQRHIELMSARSAYLQMLEMFLHRKVGEGTIFQKPSLGSLSSEIQRPELNLYSHQKKNIEASRALLSARKHPRVELFVQGGYGRPALNMLENRFDTYYVGGIRFQWQLSGFYTFKNEKQILDVQQQSVSVQRETFLFNTGTALKQYDLEISKLRQLITVDMQIVDLRTRVKNTAHQQLEYGTITADDYIREVNAEDQARQNQALHEVQLLQAIANHHFYTGDVSQQ